MLGPEGHRVWGPHRNYGGGGRDGQFVWCPLFLLYMTYICWQACCKRALVFLFLISTAVRGVSFCSLVARGFDFGLDFVYLRAMGQFSQLATETMGNVAMLLSFKYDFSNHCI